ncbi:long-chain-fatty-acid--CoA ligase [Dokdonella fugitiva]|jgi:long-chain acyl-CoA synthetase|uniref:Long-chain-fatty-acid--CoA ligase n=1 Tax=Dokdonella fugitiva TaxID=328517 RepID=A0A4R2I7M9_9GAMM|nr:long-chain-fatty-acid--CoA ligase [Dokdonella fugitiva]MBA8883201.1 long-chain acyl-CoA synthetase [Dokdonella fugitiva]TCO40341.1 long-chain acyl-CoA synthetase [Dokdonella fugitiva]
MANTNRPWLANYPPGTPAEIDPGQYRSVVALLEECCDRFRHRPAFTNMGRVITYGDLDRLSATFAAFLVNDLKLAKGDRVAIMMPNVLQYPIVIMAVLRAGLTVVNVNPMYTPRELKHQLDDSGASAIIVLDNFAHTVAEVIGDTSCRHVVCTGVGDLLGFPKSVVTNFVVRHVKKMVPAYSLPNAIRFNEALGRGTRSKLGKVEVGPDDLAFLQYTGGTTGVAKGAMLTHRNMVSNMLQSSAWIGSNLREGEEVVVTALPLYHIFALTANFLVFARIGGFNHLITNPRDMPGFVKSIKSIRFSALSGVNTLFAGLLNTPGFDEVDFSRLHLTLGGGMAVQRAVAERWKKVTGCALLEAYGLTETSPAACINPLDLKEYNGSIGLPIPSTDVNIQDDDGNVLPIGEIGELCIRGPQVMKGYWNRPEETAKVLSPDGWLRTGDIARMEPSGYVYIVDRKKDMILVSGFNVYPNEVEDVVAQMPGVLEVAAVGVPDEKSGEAVKLVIVKKDPALTEEAVRAHCKANLTGYKLPKYVEFRESLPKTNVGKILRRELREPAAAP